MPSTAFLPVSSEEQICQLVILAREIWTEHFTPIIGSDQVEYMLSQFQSRQSLMKQLKDGYQYYFFVHDGGIVGYTGIRADEDALFLSKLYIKKEMRGRKIAKDAVAFLTDLCREKRLGRIWLTVNRGNINTIAAYEKMGFVKMGEQVSDIGNGFVMDDYIMEKQVDAIQ